MASSGSLFSETLQSITATKLKELSKKRATYERQKEAALATAYQESDVQASLHIIIDGVKTCFAVKMAVEKSRHRVGRRGGIVKGSTNDPSLEVSLRNMERFLEQARYDPSLSKKLLQDWEQSLKKKLNIQSLRYQYATLYGQLVTEWLSAEQPDAPPTSGDVEMLEDYEAVASGKKLESRVEWEKSVFEPAPTNEQSILIYLNTLFGTSGSKKEASKALNNLRDAVESFETRMTAPGQFTQARLEWVINGLLASDLLTDEKRAVLKDFRTSPVILSEIADVLNMRMAAFDNWTWEGDVSVEQRRKLNGTYSIMMHEDLLQAIFLAYIGVKWSVFFKGAFKNFQNFEGAWESRKKFITKSDKIRRAHFLGHQYNHQGVEDKREQIYRSKYFMAQLLDNESQETDNIEGEEEADSYAAPIQKKRKGRASQTIQTAQKQMGLTTQNRQMAMLAAQAPARRGGARFNRHRSNFLDVEAEVEEDEEDEEIEDKNPMETKQALLHLLSTEITINTRLHGEITCMRSEFDAWMPLLPHSTIFSVLKFFGASPSLLGFLKKFLEAPLKFIEDGESEPSRIRKRGVPGSHVLSEVIGEVVLFCLDYSVNQNTEGSRLHRLHNDFWLWSPNHQTCVKAWEAITEFSAVMGVSLNEDKTATVRVIRDNKTGSAAPIDPSLIPGDIRWGFLFLDPVTGRFKIDQEVVDHHISDLRQQLHSKSKSIFSWVQVWNTYATTFFTTNFGKPANCYGREHVDQILSTFERIQSGLFVSDNDNTGNTSNVAEYLKSTLRDRFGLTSIPDGYLFFPIELGGLELQSPFIGLLQIRDALIKEPSSLMDDFEEEEREAYATAKKEFESMKHVRNPNDELRQIIGDVNTFMPFDEFIKFREEYSAEYPDLLYVWETLLRKPSEESIEESTTISSALSSLTTSGALSTQIGNWHTMKPYWRWVTQLYGPEMIEQFGGLSIVDRGELPIGMVGLFRSGRVKWQG